MAPGFMSMALLYLRMMWSNRPGSTDEKYVTGSAGRSAFQVPHIGPDRVCPVIV